VLKPVFSFKFFKEALKNLDNEIFPRSSFKLTKDKLEKYIKVFLMIFQKFFKVKEPFFQSKKLNIK
jgi:hypothetical protein